MTDTLNSIKEPRSANSCVDPAELTVRMEPSGRLPVIETVSKSYLFLFHHGRELLQLIWPLAVIEFVGLWGYFLNRDIATTQAMTPIQAAYLSVALAAAIPMIARVQRFALNPRATSSWLDFQFGKDDLLILGALMAHLAPIALTFLVTAITMIALTDIELGVVSTDVAILAIISSVLFSTLAARLVLIYPATLSLRSVAIRTAWALSRPHFVRLLTICVFATVPFRLIYRLSDIASHHIWFNLPDPLFLKTLIYLGVVILPTTLSVLGQIVVTFVALTITYSCLTTHREQETLAYSPA